MFSEILKIIPKLDNSALNKMTKTLQSRFTKIAKGFGNGLKNALKFGGVASLALGLVDKLLNPLQDVQESIERSLQASDDISTNARQFETTSGKLQKLVALGSATGLDQQSLFTLMQKFQSAVADAAANPNDPSAVKNFVGQTDSAEAFFDFIQGLQKLDKTNQLLVQKEVFGEKQILKMADFLQSDFPALIGRLGLDKISSQRLTTDTNKLSDLNDLAAELKAGQTINDVAAKAGVINESMILAKANADQLALNRENQRIQSFNNLQTISDTVTKMGTLLESLLNQVGSFITWVTPTINGLIDRVDKLLKSPLVKGIKGIFGGGE